MPESFFILSKEFPTLAFDEVLSIAKTYDRFSKVTGAESNLVIIQTTTPWEKIARRAAFVKLAGKVARKYSDLCFDKDNMALLSKANSFACRIINLSNKAINRQEVENTMGLLISKFLQVKVSLKNPEITIYLILTPHENFFAISCDYERPLCPTKTVKHPHELDWKLTRAMINLAGLKEGDTVCDPFCGTGTTMIEAEDMRIRSLGIDFDKDSCSASKENLRSNGYEPRVINADYSYIKSLEENFGGIVTDMPYGQSSKSSEEPMKMVHKFVSMIPKSKKLAIMCKKGNGDGIEWEGAKRYDIYRHKSLVRTILVK